MIFTHSLTRYRSYPVPDGEGGFVDSLDGGQTFFGSLVELYGKETFVIVDAYEDVIVGDIIAVQDSPAAPPLAPVLSSGGDDIVGGDGTPIVLQLPAPTAQYLVMASMHMPRTQQRKLTLERLSRPLSPSV